MLHHYGHPKFAAAMEEYLRMNSIGSLFSVWDFLHVPNWVSAVDHDMQLDPQLFDSLERLIRTHGHAGQAEANRLIWQLIRPVRNGKPKYRENYSPYLAGGNAECSEGPGWSSRRC